MSDLNYAVIYGGYGGISDSSRTDYMSRENAEKIYEELNLSESLTWKKLVHESEKEPEVQHIIKSATSSRLHFK